MDVLRLFKAVADTPALRQIATTATEEGASKIKSVAKESATVFATIALGDQIYNGSQHAKKFFDSKTTPSPSSTEARKKIFGQSALTLEENNHGVTFSF
jgi:hypothetical protein